LTDSRPVCSNRRETWLTSGSSVVTDAEAVVSNLPPSVSRKQL
jgi:hypothetical protein